jgi:tripartite-type tricarboxylate transporter receptor subunit TctC
MPAKDLKELIAWLKANPNKASMGAPSAFGRLLAAFFQKETGTQVASVPFCGQAILPNLHDALGAGEETYHQRMVDRLKLSRHRAILY